MCKRCGTKGIKLQKGGLYEHQLGGSVIVTDVTETTVKYSNISVPELDSGENESILEFFNGQFHYVAG